MNVILAVLLILNLHNTSSVVFILYLEHLFACWEGTDLYIIISNHFIAFNVHTQQPITVTKPIPGQCSHFIPPENT